MTYILSITLDHLNFYDDELIFTTQINPSQNFINYIIVRNFMIAVSLRLTPLPYILNVAPSLHKALAVK